MYLRFKWQFALRLSGYIFRPLSGCMVWTLANKKLFLGLISYCSPVVTSSRNLANVCPTVVVLLVHNYNSVGQVSVLEYGDVRSLEWLKPNGEPIQTACFCPI